jgi:hypothetical protein
MKSNAVPQPAAGVRLPWPLPALLVWAAAWASFGLAGQWLPGRPALALALASALGLLAARWQGSRSRRWLVAGGFPLSCAVLAASASGAWIWLALLLLSVALYPLRAWRDAPVFPTPAAALEGMATSLHLAPGARVLDAGSGLGDGLIALARAWPAAQIEGIEWSRVLAWLSRLRCRAARVRVGDMWSAGAWRDVDLVYLFQRPESMARAWRKACDELPGGWLLSLEFEVPGRRPELCHVLPGGRQVLAWRVPGLNPGAKPPITATNSV